MSTCAKCGTRYPTNVKFCTRDGTVLEEDAPAETDQVGKVLAGKYRLDGYLSRGGMGSVFRATHLMLEKQVALKIIKPELVGSSEFVRRFQREARAATSLNHPNIVGVYDLGQAEDGTLYIAMEFVDGATLKEVIRASGPMDPIRIVRIVRQILSALALAHRHQIVHRDLKPQNIMLRTDRDGNEIAKLVDFGIAKTFDDRTQLTGTGFAIGTPQYMAPEQAAGTEVDGRSDLYSLGIILYEMLVAEVPFNDPSTPAILVKHLTQVPVRPSERRKDVPVHPGLEDVAVRCLEKDPAKRFQTAEEVAQAIAAAVSLDEHAVSVSDAATLAMNAPHLSMASTRTAAPVPAAFDSSMAPTIKPTAPAAAGLAAPTVLDPAPAMPTAPAGLDAAPTAVPSAPPAPMASPPTTPGPTSAAASPAASAGYVAPSPPPAAVAPPPPASKSQPPPAMKSGRNSLALGVGALAIVALAGMGFAIQHFVGGSDPAEPNVAFAITGAEPASASSPQPPASAPAMNPQTSAGSSSPGAGDARGAVDAAAVTPPASASPSERAGSARRDATPPARDPRKSAAASRTPAASATREAAAPPREAPPAAPTAPSAPPAPQLAEHPTVLLRCDGAPEICGAVRDAFGSAFERERMPLTSSAQRADVYVVVSATALEGRVEQQFGTTFATRTYALSVELEAPRLDAALNAPQSRTFSADLRVGRERIAENARLVAMDTAQKIREFWTRRRAAGN